MAEKLIYITTADKTEAARIGRMLVEKRLVACVNILDPMSSIYWWDDKIEEATETVLIAKTIEKAVPAVLALVKAMHSYDCPAVVVLDIGSGNPDYLNWIRQNVRPA